MEPASRRALRSLLPAVALALWLIGLAAPSAEGHSELLASEPALGAVLAVAPSALSMSFSEDLMPKYSAVTLTVPGVTTRALRVAVRGDTLAAAVPSPAKAAAGRWVAAYRVVSVDGHLISGTIAFTVREVPKAASTTPVPTTTTAAMPQGVQATHPPAVVTPVGAAASAASTVVPLHSGSRGWWMAGGAAVLSGLVAAVGLRRRA